MKVGDETAWGNSGAVDTSIPDPGIMDNLRLQTAVGLEYGKEAVQKLLRVSPAVGAVAIAALAVSFPGAKQEAVQETVVQTDIASAPAELRITGNGWSSLELGLPGTYFSEKTAGGTGMSARLEDMPSVGGGTVQDLLSPEFQDLVGGVFNDPQAAVEGYVNQLSDEARANFLENEAERTIEILVLAGGALVVSLFSMGKERRQKLSENALKASLVVAASTIPIGAVGYAAASLSADKGYSEWAATNPSPAPGRQFKIYGLEDTPVEGTVASNPILQIATNEALPAYEKNKERMEEATNNYIATATASFLSQIDSIEPPRPGEKLVIGLSDTHGNVAMTRVANFMVNTLNQRFGAGTVSMVTISGDLTMNGSPAEKGSIDALGLIGQGDPDTEEDDTPIVAVSGNHESDVSIEQMHDAGMIVPNLETKLVDGISVLGANDTDQNKLGTSTTYQNDISEAELGTMTRDQAVEDNPDVVLLHQGYAVMSFLKLDIGNQTDIMNFLADNGVADKYFTTYREDGIENVPTRLIDFGHWHVPTTHRVIWNKDENTGEVTWTLVRQLNTSGGGDANPTINHFSVPTYPPIQNAGIEFTYMNSETGLVTGFASHIFTPGAAFIPDMRTDVGLPGGEPVIFGATQTVSKDKPFRANDK